jgi:hypothetical protein
MPANGAPASGLPASGLPVWEARAPGMHTLPGMRTPKVRIMEARVMGAPA